MFGITHRTNLHHSNINKTVAASFGVPLNLYEHEVSHVITTFSGRH
ncbi:Uncharacterised protein [Vibrio cholerae]|nr:Uncharacterised protein [Vibrio cholerae]